MNFCEYCLEGKTMDASCLQWASHFSQRNIRRILATMIFSVMPHPNAAIDPAAALLNTHFTHFKNDICFFFLIYNVTFYFVERIMHSLAKPSMVCNLFLKLKVTFYLIKKKLNVELKNKLCLKRSFIFKREGIEIFFSLSSHAWNKSGSFIILFVAVLRFIWIRKKTSNELIFLLTWNERAARRFTIPHWVFLNWLFHCFCWGCRNDRVLATGGKSAYWKKNS